MQSGAVSPVFDRLNQVFSGYFSADVCDGGRRPGGLSPRYRELPCRTQELKWNMDGARSSFLTKNVSTKCVRILQPTKPRDTCSGPLRGSRDIHAMRNYHAATALSSRTFRASTASPDTALTTDHYRAVPWPGQLLQSQTALVCSLCTQMPRTSDGDISVRLRLSHSFSHN